MRRAPDGSCQRCMWRDMVSKRGGSEHLYAAKTDTEIRKGILKAKVLSNERAEHWANCSTRCIVACLVVKK